MSMSRSLRPPNNATGGEPNGNIRNGFIYNPNRVSLRRRQPRADRRRAPSTAAASPLVARLHLQRRDVTADQRPLHFARSEATRSSAPTSRRPTPATARAPHRRRRSRLYRRPSRRPIRICISECIGDFNGFYFEDAVGASDRRRRADRPSHGLLTAEERYSYLFDGNLQAIDHMLVTGGLLPARNMTRSTSTPSSPGRRAAPIMTRRWLCSSSPSRTRRRTTSCSTIRRSTRTSPPERLVGTLSATDKPSRHVDLCADRRCRRPLRGRRADRRADHHRRLRP